MFFFNITNITLTQSNITYMSCSFFRCIRNEFFSKTLIPASEIVNLSRFSGNFFGKDTNFIPWQRHSISISWTWVLFQQWHHFSFLSKPCKAVSSSLVRLFCVNTRHIIVLINNTSRGMNIFNSTLEFVRCVTCICILLN